MLLLKANHWQQLLKFILWSLGRELSIAYFVERQACHFFFMSNQRQWKSRKHQGFYPRTVSDITNIHELDSRFNSVHYWLLKWLDFFRSIVIKWQFLWKLHMKFSACLKEHLSKLVHIYHHNCVSQWYMYYKIVNVTFSSYIQKMQSWIHKL